MNDIITSALDGLRGAGADKAQVWFTRTEKTELNMEAGELTLLRTTFNSNVSLTALAGNRKGTQSTNQLDLLGDCITEAVEQARGAQEDSANDIAELEPGEQSYTEGAETCDIEGLYNRFTEMLDDTKTRFPNIRMVDGVCEFVRSYRAVGNTNGVNLEESGGEYGMSCTFSAFNEKETTSMNYTFFSMPDLSKPLMKLGGLESLLEQSVKELGASPVGEKFVGDVITSPQVTGNLVEYYVSNFLADRVLIAGTSPLASKLGERVACDSVTLVSNPLDPEYIPSHLTADGYRVKNMTVINKGQLESFVLGQYGANKTGRSRSGNTGEAVCILPGDKTVDEMIAGVGKGIFIGRFSGGNPSDNGDISGVAKNAFLIENGKITHPLQETMISGNLLEMFNNIKEISRETISNGYRGQPWLKISGVTVS